MADEPKTTPAPAPAPAPAPVPAPAPAPTIGDQAKAVVDGAIAQAKVVVAAVEAKVEAVAPQIAPAVEAGVQAAEVEAAAKAAALITHLKALIGGERTASTAEAVEAHALNLFGHLRDFIQREIAAAKKS